MTSCTAGTATPSSAAHTEATSSSAGPEADTYFGLKGGGNDRVYDYGGSSDVLDLSEVARSEVLITRLDTSDADTNLDSLRVEKKGTTNTVLVYHYFDNSGGLGKGRGAIESIKFKDKTVGFPASEG